MLRNQLLVCWVRRSHTLLILLGGICRLFSCRLQILIHLEKRSKVSNQNCNEWIYLFLKFEQHSLVDLHFLKKYYFRLTCDRPGICAFHSFKLNKSCVGYISTQFFGVFAHQILLTRFLTSSPCKVMYHKYYDTLRQIPHRQSTWEMLGLFVHPISIRGEKIWLVK